MASQSEAHGLEIPIEVLPVALAILLPVTFIVAYFLAVGEGHISPVWPYMSDTGAVPPESCFVAEMANLGALLMALIVFIRYLILRDFAHNHSCRQFEGLIVGNVALGLLGALGASFVANYQSVNVQNIHDVGAFLLFGLGVIYLWIDVVLSFCSKILPKVTRTTAYVRAILATSVSAGIITTLVGTILAEQYRDKTSGLTPKQQRLHWTSDQPGWHAHICSTISEWLTMLMLLLYFVTFVPEFKHFRLPVPSLRALDRTLTPPSRISPEPNEVIPLLSRSKKDQYIFIGSGN